MADDMGYSDLGCYGGEIETPNIDRLAAEGLRFSQFYNASICGTTRASLMTGLYHHQVGVRTWNGVRNDRCLNIGEALQEAGYRTMMVGKWTDTKSPSFKGFDRSFGSLANKGPTNYFKMNRTDEHFLDEEIYPLPEEGYFKTDAYTDYAVQFMHEAADIDQPFFLYVAYLAPHWPLHAKEEDIAKYRQKYLDLGWDRCRAQRYDRQQEMGLISDAPPTPRDTRVPPWDETEHRAWEAERMAVYAAQVDCMDQNIGRILKALKETGREENTVIMFLSDNGATERYPKARADGSFYLDQEDETWRTDGTRTRPVVPGVMPGPADTFGGYGPEWAHVSNTPVRGYKIDNYEGGIITPLIVKWPGRIQDTGGISRQVGHVIDVMPTCLEIAGDEYPEEYRGREILPVEGKSLVPVFEGKQRLGHDALFWELLGARAVRIGDWKLIAQKDSDWELYDLDSDRAESHDRASDYPGKAAEMSAIYRAWSARCNEGR
jgi:arylsulfatase